MIEQFHFLRPAWLLLLPLLALLLYLLARHRLDASRWRQVVDARLLPHLLVGGGAARRWPLWVFGLVATLAIVALAGPTWERRPQPVYHNEAALVIALDLSRSMDASDLKPSRLARARHKIVDLLAARDEGQTALVVYARDAFAVTPLTSDTETILTLLPSLDTSLMPAQGSRAERSLELAFELFAGGGVPRGDLLLVSDGLDALALERLRERLDGSPHRLSVLAVGTVAGGPIPLHNGGFLKDTDGAIVVTALAEDNLRAAAEAGNGVYAAISADDLDINALVYLFESGLAAAGVRASERSTELWREFGPWLLLLALPFAALAFRRGMPYAVALGILVSAPPDAQALDWVSLWQSDDRRARALFDAQDHAAAAATFEDPDWRATAAYRAGDLDAAIETWKRLDGARARYNRATALAGLGRYAEALDEYSRLLERNPDHADARYNKRQIEDWLEQQQRQQQESQAQGDAGDEQRRQSAGQQSGERDQSRAAAGDDAQRSEETGDAAEAVSGERDEATAGADPAAEAESAGELPGEALAKVEQQMSEQATEQWLRKIPDDPGGLLRRKFLFQYRQRGGVDREGDPW